MAGKPREKRENWLLIKGDDDAARRPRRARHPRGAAGIGEDRPRRSRRSPARQPGWSSKTGKIERGGAEPAAADRRLDAAKMKGAKKARLAGFRRADAGDAGQQGPAGERWLHEIKFDGYRLQARIEAGRVKLLTRSGLDWTAKFGKDLAAALQALPVGTRADRRRARGREPERRIGFLAAAGRPERRRARPLRLLCLRPPPSRRLRSARHCR